MRILYFPAAAWLPMLILAADTPNVGNNNGHLHIEALL